MLPKSGASALKETNQKSNVQDFTSRAGVGGLLRSINEKSHQTEEHLREAFEDLNCLMKNAEQMVVIAQQLANQVEKGEEDEALTSFRHDMCMNLGIQTPVSKSLGDKYHTELAKQLARFLERPLDRAGGMLSLIDVYCMYNRALGTELISPKDLYESARLFKRLQLPIVLRKFESGFLAVQSETYSEQQTINRIVQLVQNKPVTALDVSKNLVISVQLAKEQLWTAERKGSICRDESAQGCVYYPNKFFV